MGALLLHVFSCLPVLGLLENVWRRSALFFHALKVVFGGDLEKSENYSELNSPFEIWAEKRGVLPIMRLVLMVVAVLLSGGWAMAKEKKMAQDSRVGNLSKLHREQLSAKVAEIRSYLLEASVADTNVARLLSFVAELEKEVRSKKYGLIFEEHKERVDIELEENIPVLTENKKRFIDNGGEMNFLVEGDNLAALKLLEKTHRGKIDLIYIDPPYNTGNKDFIYNDSFVDKTDGYRHSKWLSFMEKRLKIARRLMSDRGVIFISIDDNEQAALKLLCDDMFGFGNFMGMITRATGTTTGQDTGSLGKACDYVLVYSRHIGYMIGGIPLSEKDLERYDMTDERGKYSILQLRRTGNEDRREDRPTMFFPIEAPDGTQVYPYGPTGYESRWRVGPETVTKMRAENRLYFKRDKNGEWKVYYKFYADGKTKRPSNLWVDLDGNKKAQKELKGVLPKTTFETPKPLMLLERIMQIASFPNSTILDFFAGSGTTGHAVMKLNAEDGGKRKFILVTNNENGICEKVTYERLKRVINKEKYAAKLKYFKVDYVPITEEGYWERAEELLKYIRELVELENGIDFVHDKSVAIVLTDEEAETLLKDKKRLASCKTLYRGHNVMFSAKMNAQLSDRGIEIRMIPDYYYPELED